MLTPRIIYIHFLCDTKQLYVYYENIVILIPILLKIWVFFNIFQEEEAMKRRHSAAKEMVSGHTPSIYSQISK